MGALYFEADIDIKQILLKTNQIDRNLTRLAQQAANSGSMLDRSFQNASKSASLLGNDILSLQRNLLGIASVYTLRRLGEQVVSIRGEFQQLGIAFEVMLGSKEKADKLMQEQITFAQKTPFTLTDVATNTKQLLAMGIATEKVMGTMKALGDVAAGTSVPISRVAINYGQVATIGKLQGRELRDFAMAGIPLIDELAKNLGKAKSEIAGMVEAGQIGFPDVEKAFQTMTSEGGKFYNLMERQNKSVTGQISNLTDKLQVMANKIGQSNEGLIYAGISGLSTMVDHYEEILKVLEALIATYGIYRAALMLTTAAQNINTISTMASEWMVMGKAVGFAAANQMLFNSALLANPVVAAIAGITALIAVMLIFSEKAKTAEDHIKDLNDSMAQIGKQMEVETAIQKYEELSQKTEKTKEEQDELNKTIQKLAVIFPGAVTETNKFGQAVGLVTEKLIAQNKELRDSLVLASQKKAQDAQKSLNDLLAEQVQLTNQINTGQQVTKIPYSRGGSARDIVTVFTPEEIEAKKARLGELATEIVNFGSTVDKENSEIMRLKTVEATEILAGYKDLFVDVAKFTKQGAIDAKTKLQQIVTPEGSMAGDLVKQQITALDKYIEKLKTTGEQEKEWRTQLAAAQKQLEIINKEGYESLDPAKDKADQEAIIKDLKEKLGLNKKQKEAVDELKVANEELARAVKTGDGAAARSATKRITALEQEKRRLEDLMELEMRRAWRNQFDGQKMDLITPIPSKTTSDITNWGNTGIDAAGNLKTETTLSGKKILYEITAIDKTGPTWKKVGLQGKKLQNEIDEGIKKAGKLQKDINQENEEAEKNKLELQKQLIDGGYEIINQLIDQSSLTDQQAQSMKEIVSIAANLASRNYVGAAVSFVSGVFTQQVKEQDIIQQQVKAINDLYKQQNFELERQIDLLSKSSGSERTNNEKRTLDIIKQQQKELEDAARLLEVTASKTERSGLFGLGSKTKSFTDKGSVWDYSPDIIGKWNEYLATVDSYSKSGYTLTGMDDVLALLDKYKELEQERQRLLQEFTATTSEDIANTITEGFTAGKDSMMDFADSFEEMMKNALLNSFKTQYLLKASQGFFDKFSSSMDGGLTKEEIDTLRVEYQKLIEDGNMQFESYKEFAKQAGIDLVGSSSASSSVSAATGIAAQATEEAVTAMVGQAMAIRVDMKISQDIGRSQLELFDQGLNVWRDIERNTRPIYRLENIENELKDLNRIVKEKL